LIELELDPRIYRTTDAGALAQNIVDTIRQAVELAADEAFVLTREVLSPKATRAAADLAFDPVLNLLEAGGR
jgi:hypothetical protein